MIEGKLGFVRPDVIINYRTNLARSNGADVLRIKGTVARYMVKTELAKVGISSCSIVMEM